MFNYYNEIVLLFGLVLLVIGLLNIKRHKDD
jgi:hypothetical protein